MKLRKQLVAAFLAVAIVPLLVVSLYLFTTSIGLAFDLYGRNLYNSAQLQAGMVGDSIIRMMVRAGNLATARSVRAYCQGAGQLDPSMSAELSGEILKFTDETLDSVSIFALIAQDGAILYSSGSNSDTAALQRRAADMGWSSSQSVVEIELDAGEQGLSILTPVLVDGERIGGFVVMFRSDYFLKSISSHKQLEASNAFLYCLNHHRTVTSKLGMDHTGILQDMEIQAAQEAQGTLTVSIGGEKQLCYYRQVPKTPWLLVNTVPTRQVYSQLWQYIFASLMLLIGSMTVIIILSRRISVKILKPLEQLLTTVEQFFLSGAQVFPSLDADPKTEIGYLASKFAGMANQIAAGQRKLQESTYLYETLLKATYELRVIIDLNGDTATSSNEDMNRRLEILAAQPMAQRVLDAIRVHESTPAQTLDALTDIVTGCCTAPTDIELYCDLLGGYRWYRMLSAPLFHEGQGVQQVVLHFEDIHEKKSEELRLIQSSQADPLCGMLNKNAFYPHCILSPVGISDAVFFIDLDGFKQVNDALGHAAGDEMLIATANAIRAQFRNTDVFGRYGGDEFVVFAPRMNLTQAKKRAQRLVDALTFEKVDNEGNALHITASVGVCITHPGMDLAKALEVADEAMYRAKQRGKSQYYVA